MPRGDRRDGLGENDADDAVHGRDGPHEPRDDRLHAAAARGGHVRGRARLQGARRRVGPRGRLLDPVRGLHVARHGHQVHDGRHVTARVPRRAGPRVVLRHDDRRGARADSTHGRAVRSDQRHRAVSRGHQDHHLVGDDERRGVFDVLRRRRDLQHSRPDVRRRDLVHEAARGGLPRRGRRHGPPDAHHAAVPGRHPGLLDGPGRNRGLRGDSLRTDQGARRAHQGAHDLPHLRVVTLRTAGENLRADAERRAESRHRHQHRRDVVDHRGHLLRGGHGLLQAEDVQPAVRHRVVDRHADLAGPGLATSGESR
mmetsp:Transcript_20750/g.65262  ORF Transcript_20750/g.65262 Transcript_20750/m.65262 type:complete len:312 (+) Transcript_20750:1457-2392(+)